MPTAQPPGAYRQLPTGFPGDAKFSADGTRLAVASGNRLLVYDLATGNAIADLDYGAALGGIDYSPDGRYVAAIVQTGPGEGGLIKVFDQQTGTTATYTIPAGPNLTGSLHDIAFLANGHVLLSQVAQGTLIEYDLATGTAAFHSGPEARSTLVASADHGEVLVIGPSILLRTDVFTSGSGITATLVARPDPYAGASVPSPPVLSGAVSPDGTLFAVGEGIILRNPALGTVRDIDFSFMGNAMGMAFSPAGDRLYLLSQSNQIVVVDPATGQPLSIYAVGGAALNPDWAYGDLLLLSGDGRYLSVMTADGMVVIDLTAALPLATSGNDTISEEGTIVALGGNDTIDGIGAQWMFGGTGDDTYIVDSYFDTPVEYEGEGTDTVLLHDPGMYFLHNNIEIVTVAPGIAGWLIGNGSDNLFTGAAAADRLAGMSGNDQIAGGDGDDNLSGGTGADTVSGGAGNDLLSSDEAQGYSDIPLDDAGIEFDSVLGNDGDDTVWIGYGDSADGGAGSDSLSLALAGAPGAVTISTAGLVNAAPLVLNGGTIANFEVLVRLAGSEFGDSITVAGLSGAISIDGRAGNDTVYAGTTPVVFTGGSGNDRFYSGSAVDTFDGGDGSDTADYSLYGGPVSVSLESGGGAGDLLNAVENVTGSDHGDIIFGSYFENLISGGGGNDVLDGGGGGDTVLGGAGNDRLVASINAFSGPVLDGGEGSDTADFSAYYFGAYIVLASTIAAPQNSSGGHVLNDIENAIGGEGNDTVQGTDGANRIETGNGNDQIFGYGGGDTLIGGGGDDAYYIASSDDGVVELADAGIDHVHAAAASYFLPDHVENLTSQYYGNAVDFTGNALDNVILSSDGADFLRGLGGNDLIYGGEGNDWLEGGEGDDHLDGGAGDDAMIGGFGNDSYAINSLGDIIVEALDGGTDTLLTPFDAYLGSHAQLENLTLMAGSENSYGVGTAAANVLTGNNGDNLLIAGAGDDTIHGGDGNDLIFGEDGADTLYGEAGIDYIAGGSGDDWIEGGDNPDALYGEDGNDRLDGGNSFDTDILVGGAGNDILDGVSDQANPDYDLMDGGDGDDQYWVDTGADLTFEAAGGGNDTVYAFVPVPGAGVYLYAHVENLVLGDGAFGVGNALDNSIRGSNSDNWLLGGAGNDRIFGSGGNDVLFGEAGADTFVYFSPPFDDTPGPLSNNALSDGQDVIGDFNLAEDKIEFGSWFTSFAQVQANFVQVGNDGAINLGGAVVVLQGVTMANLTAANFVFAAAGEPSPMVKAAADAFAFAASAPEWDEWHGAWHHAVLA
jgi:Ca2+-binding RTX toxin-like protein